MPWKSQDDLQECDSHANNSDWKKILTSSPGTLAYGFVDFGVFMTIVIHLPSEKSIIPKFSSPGGVAILGWESLSQAGSANRPEKSDQNLSFPFSCWDNCNNIMVFAITKTISLRLCANYWDLLLKFDNLGSTLTTAVEILGGPVLEGWLCSVHCVHQKYKK